MSRHAVELAEACASPGLLALVIAYKVFYHISIGDMATGRARQDLAACRAPSTR
jgi:hypothetical protein